MRTVHLYGALGRAFGRKFRLDVSSPVEAVRALSVQLKGFRDMIATGRFRVVSGHPNKGWHYPDDADTLRLRMGKKSRDLHIIPVVAGAGGKGGFGAMIVIGLTLIAGALFVGAPAFAAFAGTLGLGAGAGSIAFNATLAIGASLALQGVSGLLAKTPKALGGDVDDEASRRESFLFGSIAQGTLQGRPVPVVFGRVRVTAVPISLGLAVEDT